jgi:hypothetical protein
MRSSTRSSAIARLASRAGLRWIVGPLAVVLVVGTAATATAGTSAPAAPSAAPSTYSTALQYVIRFWPRYITYWVQTHTLQNTLFGALTGPSGIIGPKVRAVSAPNSDTTYTLTFNLNLSQGPEILTIPPTTVRHSVQFVDVWGDVLKLIDTTGPPGHYGLVLPSFRGVLPRGVTKVVVPYPTTEMLLRADRYTKGVNTVAAGKAWARDCRLASLPAYKKNPNSGGTIFLPQFLFSSSSLQIAEDTIQNAPMRFLQQLQAALRSSTTRPFTNSDFRLAASFNAAFAAAQRAQAQGNYKPMSDIVRAAQNAYSMIVGNYQSHVVGGSEWIHFDNFGTWGTDYLDRAGGESYITYGNVAASQGYYDAFTDANGQELDASNTRLYRMTFSKAKIPQNDRFWSLTVYVPPAISPPVVGPGSTPAAHVASYNPGLVTSSNGSIKVYIQARPPANPKLRPNWEQIPASGPFTIVLRVYSPTGNTAPGKTYVPPPILPFGISIDSAGD